LRSTAAFAVSNVGECGLAAFGQDVCSSGCVGVSVEEVVTDAATDSVTQ